MSDACPGLFSCPRGATTPSFPGSARERNDFEALPRSNEREAEPHSQCVPRQSLGTRIIALPGDRHRCIRAAESYLWVHCNVLGFVNLNRMEPCSLWLRESAPHHGLEKGPGEYHSRLFRFEHT